MSGSSAGTSPTVPASAPARVPAADRRLIQTRLGGYRRYLDRLCRTSVTMCHRGPAPLGGTALSVIGVLAGILLVAAVGGFLLSRRSSNDGQSLADYRQAMDSLARRTIDLTDRPAAVDVRNDVAGNRGLTEAELLDASARRVPSWGGLISGHVPRR